MTDTPAQARYREDAAVLARIGRCLVGQLEPITVRLPADLAEQAALAWAREDERPSGPENQELMLLRHFSATLSFVGLAVGDDRAGPGQEVEVTLRPEDIAGCLFAAEHASHVKHAEGPDPLRPHDR